MKLIPLKFRKCTVRHHKKVNEENFSLSLNSENYRTPVGKSASMERGNANGKVGVCGRWHLLEGPSYRAAHLSRQHGGKKTQKTQDVMGLEGLLRADRLKTQLGRSD